MWRRDPGFCSGDSVMSYFVMVCADERLQKGARFFFLPVLKSDSEASFTVRFFLFRQKFFLGVLIFWVFFFFFG